MTAIIKRLLALATAFTLALNLVGCGVDVTGVSLNLPDTIEKGTTLVATPEYAFDGATPETAELEKKLDKLEMRYTSSDPSILVVDDNGNLVAVSAGTAEVALSSKDGTVSTSKTLEVIISPTEIKTTDELTLTAGETATLETAVTPTDATHVSISYASSDDSIATVNDGGEVKAVANNINAMRAEGGLSALTVSSSLSSIAHDRCVYLIANDVFSHDGATTAEILCSGATSASAACTGWKNSPSHYSNIMTPGYTQMGIACTFNTAYGVEVWCVTFS